MSVFILGLWQNAQKENQTDLRHLVGRDHKKNSFGPHTYSQKKFQLNRFGRRIVMEDTDRQTDAQRITKTWPGLAVYRFERAPFGRSNNHISSSTAPFELTSTAESRSRFLRALRALRGKDNASWLPPPSAPFRYAPLRYAGCG